MTTLVSCGRDFSGHGGSGDSHVVVDMVAVGMPTAQLTMVGENRGGGSYNDFGNGSY
jgi:hypothetical protein